MLKQNTQNGFSVIEVSIVIAVVAIIGALGWKFYDSFSSKTQANNVSTDAASVDIKPDTLSDLTEISTIQKDVLTDKPGVIVTHIELEQNTAGNLVYKAQLSDGSVTVYNARTGARIKTTPGTAKSTETLPANFTSGIGFARAVEIARAEKPNSKVYKIELELEGGVVVYSVRFSDKARVDVNFLTGAIVRTKAARTETPAASPESASKSGSSNSSSSSNSGSSTSSSSSSTDDSSSHHSGSGSDDSSSRHSGSDDSGHHDDSDDLSDSDDDDDNDSDSDDDSGKDSDDNSGSGSGRN